MGFFDEEERYLNYFTFKKIIQKKGYKIVEYYTRQLIRLPPIKGLGRVNVEPINDYIYSGYFGTTLVGVFKK